MLLEMAPPAIRTSGLTKDYGAGRGIFDLDMQVNPRQVFGVLGDEAAGKTTLVRLLMGLILPTRGSAYVFGLDSFREGADAKRRVGYVPAQPPDFGSTRANEVVGYVAGLRRGVNRDDVRELVERLDLDLGTRCRDYGAGDRQKLSILLAFMHRPDLLILDEPRQRLDSEAAQELRSLISESRADGATVFLTTDTLAEAEQLCDTVAFLRRGKLARVARGEDLPKALPP